MAHQFKHVTEEKIKRLIKLAEKRHDLIWKKSLEKILKEGFAKETPLHNSPI